MPNMSDRKPDMRCTCVNGPINTYGWPASDIRPVVNNVNAQWATPKATSFAGLKYKSPASGVHAYDIAVLDLQSNPYKVSANIQNNEAGGAISSHGICIRMFYDSVDPLTGSEYVIAYVKRDAAGSVTLNLENQSGILASAVSLGAYACGAAQELAVYDNGDRVWATYGGKVIGSTAVANYGDSSYQHIGFFFNAPSAIASNQTFDNMAAWF